MDEDLDLLFDDDLDLELLEGNPQAQGKEDEFEDDDDDLDLNQLLEVAETVEQQHAVNKNNISFVDENAEDPTPPPPLPESTPCFHPFDAQNLRTWIYPTNYPVRSYQLNIVKKALFNNTLVALPTGLGKTFIAAVVMYNFYRWFPHSKVVFMAPTRPLVTQQIEACFSICGIPQSDTTDMMGTTSPAKRRELWKSKRIFYATPQTFQKDLETKGCPAEQVCCVVVDEAHRASGNYAYTQAIHKLYAKNKEFRILALTATPGSTLDAVQEVINNLHITHIQIRTEDSMDIREYTHGKQIERRIVRLDYTEGSTGILPKIISDFRNKVFLPLLEDLSKKPTNVVASVDRASPYALRSMRTHFTLTAKNLNNNLKFYVTSLFLVAEDASRAHDLLCQHGIVPFVESIESKFQEYKNIQEEGRRLSKAQQAFYNHPALNAIMRTLRAQVEKPDFVGHPKLEQLTTILLNHFTSNEGSKVMVFSSWRSSVADICQVLNRHSPIIRSTSFVGQASDKSGGKGLKQSEQQEVIQKFKRNQFNVLVSTSIGEEGLDIGELDLIICFDSQASPIRMLQRMGRTGRKRQGRCILLMTETEDKKFDKAKETYERIQGLIARGGLVTYYKPNPVILPNNYKPTICRKAISIGIFQHKEPTKKRKRGNISAAFSDFTPSGTLKPDVESSFLYSFKSFESLDQVREQYWPVQKPYQVINKYMPLQTRLQSTSRVGHSRRTSQLVNIVQKIEHQIMHPGESFHATKPTVTKLVLPSKAKPKPKKDEVSKKGKEKMVEDKGKGRMVEAEDFDLNFGVEEDDASNLSWEPMLPDHIFDDTPQFDLQVIEGSTSKQVVATHDEEIEFDDDMFMDSLEFSMITQPTTGPFDDPLDAAFPFEQPHVHQDRVKFVWVGEVPKFSKEGLEVLEKRQEVFKAKHGRYMTMKFISKYQEKSAAPSMDAAQSTPLVDTAQSSFLLDTVQSPVRIQPSPIIQSLPRMESPPHMESSPLLQSSPSIQSRQFKNPSVQSPEILDSGPPADEGEGELMIDFSESAFANFLENKFSDDEGHDFPTFLFEEHSPAKPDKLAHPKKNDLEETSLFEQHSPFIEDGPEKVAISEEEPQVEEDNTEEVDLFKEEPQQHQEGGPKNAEEDEPIVLWDFDQSFLDEETSSHEPATKNSPVVVIHSEENLNDSSDDDCKGLLDKKLTIESSKKSDTASSQEKQKNSINEGIIIESSDEEAVEEQQDPHSSGKEEANSVIIYSSDEEEQLKNTPTKSSITTTPKDREDSETPLVRRHKRYRTPSEDEQGSPVSLLSLSKGIFTPSPFREDSEGSPLVLKRRMRRRPAIEEEEEEDSIIIPGQNRKRLKQQLSDSFDRDDEFDIIPTSRDVFLQRLQQSAYGAHQNRRHMDDNNENLFIDDEAEKSEDGGHTEEEVSDGSSLMNSFIDDNSSVDPSSRLSNDDGPSRRSIYTHGLMDSQPLHNRHWMNKFNADKWLNAHEEDDQEAVTEEEEEIESIQDFSSVVDRNLIDDDDFM